ncbi:MAG: hypothetical protein EAZ91_12050 [Cytophagales bacterium]|nr:MAG: hypothetical protein EAZ91_12050 [Cytophagales bacterium]
MPLSITIMLDVEIDKLTNSIENVITGETFDTIILSVLLSDARHIKKKDWQFNWKKELQDDRKQVFRLTTLANDTVIQGLLSLEDKGDHVFMHLLESALFNKGKSKVYVGVPANLVAFACKVSFESGYGGFISFVSKTLLRQHYQKTLGAKILYGDTMVIDTPEALKLVNRYFKSTIL